MAGAQGAAQGARRGRRHLLNLGKAESICTAQHRHHQALGRGHGDGDVDVVAVHDLRLIDDCIGGRHHVQGIRRGLDEGAHEAQLDAVLFQEGILHS